MFFFFQIDWKQRECDATMRVNRQSWCGDRRRCGCFDRRLARVFADHSALWGAASGGISCLAARPVEMLGRAPNKFLLAFHIEAKTVAAF